MSEMFNPGEFGQLAHPTDSNVDKRPSSSLCVGHCHLSVFDRGQTRRDVFALPSLSSTSSCGLASLRLRLSA